MTALAVQPPPPHLSPRETQVHERMKRGLSNLEIAFDLDLSYATVTVYRSTVERKLGRAPRPYFFQRDKPDPGLIDREIAAGLRCPGCYLTFAGLDCKPGRCVARENPFEHLPGLAALFRAIDNWRDAKWVHKPHRKRSADGDE